jgi:hypothetical protein
MMFRRIFMPTRSPTAALGRITRGLATQGSTLGCREVATMQRIGCVRSRSTNRQTLLSPVAGEGSSAFQQSNPGEG